MTLLFDRETQMANQVTRRVKVVCASLPQLPYISTARVMCHNRLQDVIVGFYHSAHLGVKVEVGSQLTHDLRQTRPADVLVAEWERGRPVAVGCHCSLNTHPCCAE